MQISHERPDDTLARDVVRSGDEEGAARRRLSETLT